MLCHGKDLHRGSSPSILLSYQKVLEKEDTFNLLSLSLSLQVCAITPLQLCGYDSPIGDSVSVFQQSANKQSSGILQPDVIWH